SLKQIEPMGAFNLGTFFLTIITSVPSDRWADMCDKVVSSDRSILHEIGKNTCSDNKPNGSVLELLIQFHFSVLQLETSSSRVNTKVVVQLSKLFERSQTELFKSNLKQYHSLMRLYFEELEALLGLIKRGSANLPISLLQPLLLDIDLIQIYRNVRSSKKSAEVRPCRMSE